MKDFVVNLFSYRGVIYDSTNLASLRLFRLAAASDVNVEQNVSIVFCPIQSIGNRVSMTVDEFDEMLMSLPGVPKWEDFLNSMPEDSTITSYIPNLDVLLSDTAMEVN